MEHIKSALRDAHQALEMLMQNDEVLSRLDKASQVLAECFAKQGQVISCGNGGSMCDAMHFAEELSGRFREHRPALAAIAISDPSHISCVGNDYGYEQIFSRFVEGFGRSGDVLLGISTSGRSKNVLRAVEVAKQKGMTVIALTGHSEGPIAHLADIHICTLSPGKYADRVQELHIKCIHILIEQVERHLFGFDN